jgi:two-component system OmpR family response regulator
MRVLIVEDDRKLSALIRRGLREEGVVADVVHRGDEAVAAVAAAGDGAYDSIVLDVMLPGADGFAVCRDLRRRGVWSPVLMLTARDGVEDRVRGLDEGADDYLVKPFAFDELSARLRALARRGPVERPVLLEAGDLRLDPAGRQVWRGDVEIELSTTEFALLETFLRHRGHVLDREQLLQHAWEDSRDRFSNVVDVYVGYLRQKVDKPFGVRSIETVRGTGYRLRPDGGR